MSSPSNSKTFSILETSNFGFSKMNIEEVFKTVPSINERDFRKLFQESSLKINQDYLLSRKFKKLLGSETIPQSILRKKRTHSDSQIEFSLEDLKAVLTGTFHSEEFPRKDLLNFLVNFNKEFIEPVFDSNVFDKIYVIDSVQEYEKDALNLREGSPISFMLLHRRDLKVDVIIKKLVNKNGKIHPEYVDYLDRCQSLMNEKENTKTKKGLDFIMSMQWNDLIKVMKKFNLAKYVIRFAHFEENLNMSEIERLFMIKGNLLDMDMFYIVYNNYYLLDDKDNSWLHKILAEKEIHYTNYEIATWVSFNENIYVKNYEKLECFHKYAFPDKKICELFMKTNCFVPGLAIPEHVNRFIFDNFDKYKDSQPRMLARFVEFSLKKCDDPSFEILCSAPEKVLMKLDKLNKFFPADIDKTKELKITFLSKYQIQTKVEEIISTTNWFDFPNFHDQFMSGTIPITDVYLLKYKSKDEMFKSKLVNMPCGVCLKMVENTFIFAECSHSICLACCKNYLKTTMKINFKKEKNENKVIFYLERSSSQRYEKVKCPTCKKEIEKNDEISIVRVFI